MVYLRVLVTELDELVGVDAELPACLGGLGPSQLGESSGTDAPISDAGI